MAADGIRVLQVSKYLYPFRGGTEQVAQDIVHALKDLGVEQRVICFNEDASDGETECRRGETVHDEYDGVPVIRCGVSAKVASQSLSPTFGRELRELMEGFRPTDVILHYPNPFAAHYLLGCRRGDFRLYVYWHLDITRQKVLRRFFYAQNRRLLMCADRIVATSPNYMEGSPWLSMFREKCVAIPNCVDEGRLALAEEDRRMAGEIRGRHGKKVLCLAVGRHVPYKGMGHLIRAAGSLDGRFAIKIAGEGPLTESLEGLAAGDPKVEFLGRLPDAGLRAYLSACDIICFPSVTKNEAFGLSLAEGMYFGKPAVTFTIPGSGVNYVNLDGVTGIECPNGDEEAYAEALRRLADDAELREEYGRNARERVLGNFTYERFVRNIAALLGIPYGAASGREPLEA